MTDTTVHHSDQFIFLKQENHRKNKDAHGDVGQDKRANTSARTASRQPARSSIPMRAEQSATKIQRTQNPSIDTGRRVQLCLWVRPIVRDEIERRAKREGIKSSPCGAALLEKALQQTIDLEYSALLRPIIEDAIRENLQRVISRIALLLVRNAFDTGQTRSLAVNILGRQPDMTDDQLNEILDQSAEAAKNKITKKTPQLQKLESEIKDWLFSPDNKNE
ncbi:MAG TPA: hypothetical protein VFC02_27610 [Anaerolineales bacterium]|jgi:hypothetical protein|nr:hypothetical protein [Anaerolineales bacterium]